MFKRYPKSPAEVRPTGPAQKVSKKLCPGPGGVTHKPCSKGFQKSLLRGCPQALLKRCPKRYAEALRGGPQALLKRRLRSVAEGRPTGLAQQVPKKPCCGVACKPCSKGIHSGPGEARGVAHERCSKDVQKALLRGYTQALLKKHPKSFAGGRGVGLERGWDSWLGAWPRAPAGSMTGHWECGWERGWERRCERGWERS